MSLYLLLYVYIVIFACVSWFLNKKVVNFISFVTLIILFLFLAMRYGQGVDYFGYEILFNYWKNTSNIDEFIKEVNNIHGEYLWSWLGYVFNNILKLDFQYFVCLLAIIGIYELYCYLNCYCRANKMWAILLAFPTLYLTYMFNAMRQGIVICTFMGIMLPLLVEKKFFKYYFCTLIMLFVHTSAIVFFAINYNSRRDGNRLRFLLYDSGYLHYNTSSKSLGKDRLLSCVFTSRCRENFYVCFNQLFIL